MPNYQKQKLFQTKYSAIYDTYSANRLKLVGYALSEKMTVLPNLPVAYFAITHTELSKFNYQKSDTEGLVNYPFGIKGIKLCSSFNEAPEGNIKISFRSKGKIDVHTFASKYFNGGWYINAASRKSTLSLKETVKSLRI